MRSGSSGSRWIRWRIRPVFSLGKWIGMRVRGDSKTRIQNFLCRRKRERIRWRRITIKSKAQSVGWTIRASFRQRKIVQGFRLGCQICRISRTTKKPKANSAAVARRVHRRTIPRSQQQKNKIHNFLKVNSKDFSFRAVFRIWGSRYRRSIKKSTTLKSREIIMISWVWANGIRWRQGRAMRRVRGRAGIPK